MEADVVLGPRCLGAEYVISLAKRRATGKVAWMQGERHLELLLVSGRPQMAEDSTGQLYDEVEGVKAGFSQTGSRDNRNLSFHRNAAGPGRAFREVAN